MDSQKITLLKKTAVVQISIGAALVKKLQECIVQLASQRTNEELDSFVELISKGETEFPEEWMETINTIGTLVKTIESEAISQGATYEKDIAEISTEEN